MNIYVQKPPLWMVVSCVAIFFFTLGIMATYWNFSRLLDNKVSEIERVSIEVSRGIVQVEESVATLMGNINGLISISGTDFIGLASFYNRGEITASGESFDHGKLTAAHRTLPFGTFLAVTNLNNQRTVRVRINDRGPFIDDRIIDLSPKAALELGILKSGLVPVKLTLISMPEILLNPGRLSDKD